MTGAQATALSSVRATAWRLRTVTLDLGTRPLVMGIVNVTPDSFSDGGRFSSVESAVEHAVRLEAEGAALVDVGGESTRPYSQPVPVEEELRRVAPVFEALAGRIRVPLSVDTSKAAVARQALAAGAQVINDVTGLAGDPAMLELAVESGAGLCVMHMRGTPQTMQDNPAYGDVVGEVLAWLRSRRDELTALGIDPRRIALDPGIGFGKAQEHNLALLANIARFHELGCPVLVGHSRKGFIRKVLDEPDADPLAGTIGTALALARHGVQILRVHDVAAVRQALILFEAAGGAA